jgi:molybdopterin-guanine dinucleotide biosynthesis protein B
MTVVVAVVGAGRGRGKTTLVESLTRRFSRNIRVWTVKHISKSFDIEEKDTWRHMESGAEGTIAVSPDRLAILRPQTLTPEMAIGEVPKDVDLVLVEGFKEAGYPKILVTPSIEEAEEQLGKIRDIFAISGPIAEVKAGESVQGVPILSTEELSERLNRMIIEDHVKRLPGIDCRKCGYQSCKAFAAAILRGEAALKDCKTLQISDLSLEVDDAQVYLSEFPKNFVKNVILAMVGSLKGANVEKGKRITIEVTV